MITKHTETSAPRKLPAQRPTAGVPPLPLRRGRSFLRFAVELGAGLGALAIALLAGMAFAQGAPAAAAGDVDPMQLLQQGYAGVQSGNGWLAAGPLLTLVVWALRKYDKLIPVVGVKIDAFLNQPMVAFLLPTVLSAATGLFGALAQHLPIGPALITALKVAGAATFTFLAAKNAAEQMKGAQAAGASAAKDPGPTLGA